MSKRRSHLRIFPCFLALEGSTSRQRQLASLRLVNVNGPTTQLWCWKSTGPMCHDGGIFGR